MAKASQVGNTHPLMQDHSLPQKSVYQNEAKSVTLLSAEAAYTAPHAGVNTENLKASAGFGVNADATALNLETTVGGDLANVDLRATAGTVNAHAKLEVSAQAKGKSSGMSAVAGAGAEAMVVDGRVGGNISVTPKTVGDALGSVYNQVIDPVVDFVAGRDVPGIPEAFDHGITASGYIEGGFGASAKLNGNISLGNGDGFKVGAGGKLGLGLVGGAGASVGVK